MSVPRELRASARSAYRSLLRASATTFKGDDRVLNAFREKVRTEFREGRSQTDPTAYAARVKLGHEIADVLRKNIVQGVKVERPEQGDQSTWQIRFTKDTELGSNESIKEPPPPTRQRGGRRQTCCSTPAPEASAASLPRFAAPHEEDVDELARTESDAGEAADGSPDQSSLSSPPRKLNFSALKRAHQNRAKVELCEEDLEESFVRGSGPGGQSINKTQNNVQLVHKPTGFRVTCQETRSLQQNRLIARKRLLERLDHVANPGLSKEDLKRAKQIERERRRRKKAKKKKGSEDSK